MLKMYDVIKKELVSDDEDVIFFNLISKLFVFYFFFIFFFYGLNFFIYVVIMFIFGRYGFMFIDLF